MVIAKAAISPAAITKSYKGPIKENTLSVPNNPSNTISRLPKRIKINPHQTRACIEPTTGRRNILVCKKATFIVTHILLPKSESDFFFVNLKYFTYLDVEYANTPRVINKTIRNRKELVDRRCRRTNPWPIRFKNCSNPTWKT